MSDLMWIAIPGGAVIDQVATLRVLVVPRLATETPETLSSFGLDDWPALLQGACFTVEIAPAIAGQVSPIDATPVEAASSDTWRAFFPPTMPVAPAQGDHGGALYTTPSAAHAGRIVDGYRQSALAYADPRNTDPGAEVRQQVATWHDEAGNAPTGPAGTADWQPPDFNQAVSLLREHPAVLKELGLIVEFALRAGDLPDTGTGCPQVIRCRTTLGAGALGSFDMVSPWTWFDNDTRLFLPAPRVGSDLVKGVVDLRGTGAAGTTQADGAQPRWSIATFDVAGGVRRLHDAARAQDVARDSADDPLPPAMQSAGLALMRHGRDELLRTRVARAVRNRIAAANNTLELWADDLLLGFRVDIRGQVGPWMTLCGREATYKIDGRVLGVENLAEEGHVKAHAAVLREDDVLQANEIVARWNGWSLAVPRPVFVEQGQRQPDASRPALPFNFSYDLRQASGRLPKLRFGIGYHLRLRAADMAGGGVEPDDSSSDHGSDLVLYLRHEPIPPPEMAPPTGVLAGTGGGTSPDVAALGPGGSVDVLVIRSDPKADALLDAAGFVTAYPGYPANDARILLPPPTSLSLAEQHGSLDGDDSGTWAKAQRALTPPTATAAGTYTWLPDPAAKGVTAFIRPGSDSPDPSAIADSPWTAGPPDGLPLAAKRLKIAPTASGRPVIEWTSEPDGERLTVRLRPGEEADVELSSFLDAGDTGKFAVGAWVPRDAGALVAAGRHPMVTPPRLLRLIHAVRRPLTPPAATLVATRSPRDTWAIVADAGAPLFGANRRSTGQIDIRADWQEVGDSEDAGLTRTQVLPPLTVTRDATALAQVRHEFGDTRHRRVTYTLTAVSRFRQFFSEGSDADFAWPSTLAEVLIPSSARPVRPAVLAAAPSFRWEGSAHLTAGAVQRHRRGGSIRVELGRPWNVSGEGERLAVIVWPGPPSGDDAESATRHATRVFRDPIWTTGNVSGFAEAGMFTGTAAEAAGCTLVETGEAVIALPYLTRLHAETDRWYADVQFSPALTMSYTPLIRLALGRYQPNSLPGLTLSSVVLADFAPLFPDRTLSVQRTGDILQVLLTGVGPDGPTGNQVIVDLEASSSPTAAADALSSAAPDMAGAWHRVAGLSVSGLLNATIAVTLPAPSPGALRLLVREIETIPSAIEGNPDGSFESELRQRTVFADIVRVA